MGEVTGCTPGCPGQKRQVEGEGSAVVITITYSSEEERDEQIAIINQEVEEVPSVQFVYTSEGRVSSADSLAVAFGVGAIAAFYQII